MTQIAPDKLAVQLTAAEIRDIVIDAMADYEAPPDVVDQQGAAQYLGVSIPTLRRLVADGLPHVMVGEHRRFSRAEIWQWLKERSRGREASK